MGIEYNFINDLNELYNTAINYDTSDPQHEKMLRIYNHLITYMGELSRWQEIALRLAKNNGEAEADADRLAIEYEETLREIGGVFWEEPGEKSQALIAHKNRMERK